jgi:Zn-dependent protease
MILAEPQPTAFDLSFRLFGFPVRIHPLFWLVTLLMGNSALQEPDNPLLTLAIWVGVVFVSILVHELGHGFAYRWYGADGRLWLYWFGGLAVSSNRPARPWPSIVISLAGPAAGFLLAGFVYGSNLAANWRDNNPHAHELYWQMMWVNIAWGVVNLLPVLPLDGGQACREVCRLFRLRRADATALKISTGTAAVLALYSLMNHLGQPRELLVRLPDWARFGSLYTTLLFGVLAYSSYQMLQITNRQDAHWDHPDDDAMPWQRRR